MNKLANYFEREFELSKIEKTKLKYSIEVLFNDISKILILLVMFSILGKAKDFIYSIIALLTIRPFTGGLHFKSYMGCLLFTGVFFITSISLNAYFHMDFLMPILFAFSCMLLASVFGEILANNFP